MPDGIRRLLRIALIVLVVLGIAGGLLYLQSLRPPPPQPEPPPVATLAFDLVACKTPPKDNYCDGPPNATFTIHIATNPDQYLTAAGDGNGYAFVQNVPASLKDTDIRIAAPGYVELLIGTTTDALVANNAAGNHNLFEMKAAHFDPSTLTLSQLSAVRGGMWPLGTASTCGALPGGPRPYAADNVIATTYFDSYTTAEKKCVVEEFRARGYTHVAVGPLADDGGYHGIWPPQDWRGDKFERFLDQLQYFWDAGLAPIVFIHPDNWSLDQTKAELSDELQNPRAQRLIRIAVPSGWEPTKYGWSSCTWAEYGKWGRAMLPNALILLHTVTDVDAPAGTDALCNDDDKNQNPDGNAGAWRRVVPNIHGWLYQSAAFECPTCIGDPNHPDKTNFDNWQDNFRCSTSYSYCNRFHNGYAGWPTNSAWGNAPIKIYAGEYKAYWTFWEGRTESEGEDWGDASIAAGADGYFDSGRVAVPAPASLSSTTATMTTKTPVPRRRR